MKRMGVLRYWRLVGACLCTAFFVACMGGTGTDTDNGLEVHVSAQVIDSEGHPVSGVEITVLDATARLDSGIQNPLTDTTLQLVSDSNGFVRFNLKKAGLYTVSGRDLDTVLFLDTVRAVAKPAGVILPGYGNPQFKVERPVQAVGKVTLLSGLRADSGLAMVRGTKLQSLLSADGSYGLGWLPPSVEKFPLAIVYAVQAAETRYVKVVEQGSGWSVRGTGTGRCLADSGATPLLGAGTSNDLAGIAGAACKGLTGKVVRILKIDSTGAALGSLGEFVIPDPAAELGDSASVPMECVRPGSPGTSRASLKLSTGKIIVDDIIRGHGCPN